MGERVILDVSWTERRWRGLGAEAAEEHEAELVQIRCLLDAREAERWMRERAASGMDPSDATPEIAARMAREEDPWPQALEIDTAGPEEATLRRALGLLEDGSGPS